MHIAPIDWLAEECGTRLLAHQMMLVLWLLLLLLVC